MWSQGKNCAAKEHGRGKPLNLQQTENSEKGGAGARTPSSQAPPSSSTLSNDFMNGLIWWWMQCSYILIIPKSSPPYLRFLQNILALTRGAGQNIRNRQISKEKMAYCITDLIRMGRFKWKVTCSLYMIWSYHDTRERDTLLSRTAQSAKRGVMQRSSETKWITTMGGRRRSMRTRMISSKLEYI